MRTSETITKIAPAFLKAQMNIGAAVKDSKNPFLNTKYADLASVMEACKPHLNAQGISILQPVGRDGKDTYVETILLHESGEYISDQMLVIISPMPGKKDAPPSNVITPQAQGSAVSYTRRYALQSMCFIPAEDDDGHKASNQESNDNGVQACSRTNGQPQANKTPRPESQIARQAPKVQPVAPTTQPQEPEEVELQLEDKSVVVAIELEDGTVVDQFSLTVYIESFARQYNIVMQNGTLATFENFVSIALKMRLDDVKKMLQSKRLDYNELLKVWNLYLAKKKFHEDKAR